MFCPKTALKILWVTAAALSAREKAATGVWFKHRAWLTCRRVHWHPGAPCVSATVRHGRCFFLVGGREMGTICRALAHALRRGTIPSLAESTPLLVEDARMFDKPAQIWWKPPAQGAS